MTLDLGILLSLACAFVANLGFFYKYRGANEVRAVTVRHPLRSARALFASKWFTIGMLVAAASWSLHVAALALAPMSVVQVSLAGGVVLIAVMADRLFGFKVGRRQWVGLWLTAGGPRAARADAAGDARRGLALLRRGDDLLRGGPVRAGGPPDHGPADGRPGRAPRRDAGRGVGHPVRGVGHGDQGAHGDRRRAWRCSACC